MKVVFGIICVGLLLLWHIGIPLWAWLTTPEADLIRLRVAYEGIQGLAGPNVTVTAITRAGTYLKRQGAARRYVVDLRLPTGEARQKIVHVDAALFGPGAISQTPI